MRRKMIFAIIFTAAIFLTGCGNKNSEEDKNTHLDTNINNNNVVINNTDNTSKDEKNTGSKETSKESNTTKPGESNNNSKPSYSIDDYFIFKENVKYNYTGTNSEYAEYVTYVDYINGNKVQLRSNNGGTETVTVLQNSNGELKKIFQRNECYYRENFTNKVANIDEILLKKPLVVGTVWKLSDGSKRYISKVDVKISIGSGECSALEVTTENINGQIDLQYYTVNKGLIKSIYDANSMKVTSTLKSVEENERLNQNIRCYYPDENYNIHYEDRKFTFATNDITKISIQNLFKNFPGNNKGQLIGKNVNINSLYLNDDGMVYIDFSSNLVKEMNAGSGFESAILESITNTIGKYYGVDKVYITIDNKPYSSGHIVKAKGEYFKVTCE
ncbi:GerMN domain-containing protein [Clostridium subterminale]|uniref:GerMN domain-containing protein n=1 Tax=Clostridium subterminale TaxID=1550 RepID=A0ABN1KR12_CLOSU